MSRHTTIKFGQRCIGVGNPTYIIAEIGSNHDQDLQLAMDMIYQAADSGADAVKFQSIRFDQLYNPKTESNEFRKWFKKIELNESWHVKLAECARVAKIDFLSSPTYLDAVDLLVNCGVVALKIASPQVQGNLALLKKAAATRLPLILSMGYADYGDIARALRICAEEDNDQIVVLHCISKYPTLPSEARLGFIPTLASMTGFPVGYSDHTLGTYMAPVAVALGACIIEKHVTTSKFRNGPDHHFALSFAELREMVSKIREVETALSDGTRLYLLPEELKHRDKVKFKAISSKDLKKGDLLVHDSVIFLRSERAGITQEELGDPMRYCIRYEVPANTLLQWSDLQLR